MSDDKCMCKACQDNRIDHRNFNYLVIGVIAFVIGSYLLDRLIQ